MPAHDQFRYDGFAIDPASSVVTCSYSTAARTFTERFTFESGGDWDDPAVGAATRLLYLLAGVSYYKTTAAPLIDMGDLPTTPDERAFLMGYYVNGLAEFAYRNGLDLRDLRVTGPDAVPAPPAPYDPEPGRPLIPFGGGIDSIVTVESLAADHPDAALCIVAPPGERYAAIEDAAATTRLPVTRIVRQIDPLVRRSDEQGFLNGHVPVTAVIAAAAVVAAVLEGRDAVVLSNEWSASVPSLIEDGRAVNHQWSKGEEFERGFGQLVHRSLGPDLSVFSYLRPRTELWVSKRFAQLTQYHRTFRSCNRAFHQDPARRLDHWCGECDKCCFVDLVLAPFMDRAALAAVFAGDEPLENPANEERFRALLGLGTAPRPFECVGDAEECRSAALLAAGREDRAGSALLHRLCAELAGGTAGVDVDATTLLAPRVPIAFRIAMREPISWSALADASVGVGVWGLGVEGRASVRRLAAMGRVPVLVDDAPDSPTLDGLEVLAYGDGGLDALLRCDVVVKSPGISRYRPEVGRLEAAGVAVCGGLGLFMEDADPRRVACVTGTKGKSTTTALAVHLLTGLGYRARAGGNIGQPPWDPSPEPEPDYWIVETSSFQVPDLSQAPRVVAVTSLSPDHLDWHGTVERYYADKLSLCTKPGVDLALADGSDDLLRAQQAQLGPHLRWVTAADVARDATWSAALGLPGSHNACNVSLARAVLAGLGITAASDEDRLTEAARGFAALPSRCRSLGAVGAVEFVDDSLSTNVLPAQAALRAFEDRAVALLVGGHDRGLDYAPLARTVAARSAPTLVVTMPDNGPRIGAVVREAADGRVEVIDAASLDEAVETAFAWAHAGGVVLLSPAAPSFGRFGDYRERASAFAAAAARCGTLS